MSVISESLSLVFSIAKAQSVIIKKFDKLSVHGLGFSDLMILYLLHSDEDGQMRRIDLAEKMGLTASGVTRLLAPMEKTGLISRKTNERDARVSYVVITECGQRIFKEARITAEQIAMDVFPSLKSRNFNTVIAVLSDLGAHFK